jgi:hypothetical protein
MVVSMLGCSVYIVAQFYPTFYTLIPAGILMGLVSVTLWSAKCTYLSQVNQFFIHTYNTISCISDLAFAILRILRKMYLCVDLKVAQEYSSLSGVQPEVITVRFFGIFFFLFQCSQIWGNLISSAVLSSGLDKSSTNISVEALEKCGASFCPWNLNTTENPNLERPGDSKIYTLATIYLIVALSAALILTLFVDPVIR